MTTQASAHIAQPAGLSVSFAGLCCFFLPILCVPTVQVVGQLMLADIVIIPLFLYLLMSRHYAFVLPFARLCLGFIALWFLSAVITDVYRGTSASDFLRTWSKIVLLGSYFGAFALLIGARRERLYIAFAGIGVMFLLRWVVASNPYQLGGFFSPMAWKFGNGEGVMLLVGLALIPVSKWLQSGGLLGFAALHFLFNARALIASTVIAALAPLVSVKARSTTAQVLLVGFMLAGIAALIPIGELAYTALIEAGIAGDAALEKHRAQTRAGTGVLIGGRAEMLVSWRAVLDSPVLGHGSWAENIEYKVDYLRAREAMGMTAPWDQLHLDLQIPSHSHVLGAWIESGFAGALFWGAAFVLMARALAYGLVKQAFVSGIEYAVLLRCLWEILFSPFGLYYRLTMAVFLVGALCIIGDAKMSSGPKYLLKRRP